MDSLKPFALHNVGDHHSNPIEQKGRERIQPLLPDCSSWNTDLLPSGSPGSQALGLRLNDMEQNAMDGMCAYPKLVGWNLDLQCDGIRRRILREEIRSWVSPYWIGLVPLKVTPESSPVPLPCEDSVSRQWYMNQEALIRRLKLPAPWSQTSQALRLRNKFVLPISHPVHSHLSW